MNLSWIHSPRHAPKDVFIIPSKIGGLERLPLSRLVCVDETLKNLSHGSWPCLLHLFKKLGFTKLYYFDLSSTFLLSVLDWILLWTFNCILNNRVLQNLVLSPLGLLKRLKWLKPGEINFIGFYEASRTVLWKRK